MKVKSDGTVEHVQEHGAQPPWDRYLAVCSLTSCTLVRPGLLLSRPSDNHYPAWESGCRERQGSISTPCGVLVRGTVVVIPTLGWQHHSAFSRSLSGVSPSPTPNSGTECAPTWGLQIFGMPCPLWVGHMPHCKGRCLLDFTAPAPDPVSPAREEAGGRGNLLAGGLHTYAKLRHRALGCLWGSVLAQWVSLYSREWILSAKLKNTTTGRGGCGGREREERERVEERKNFIF